MEGITDNARLDGTDGTTEDGTGNDPGNTGTGNTPTGTTEDGTGEDPNPIGIREIAEVTPTGGNEPTKRGRGRPPKNGGNNNSNSAVTSSERGETEGGTDGTETNGHDNPLHFAAQENRPLNVPAKRGRKPKNDKERVDGLCKILSLVALANSSLQPTPQLKALWDIADDELEAIAEPLAKMLPNLPPKVVESVDRLAEPITLVFAVIGVIGTRLVMHQEIMKELRQSGRLKRGGNQTGGTNTETVVSNSAENGGGNTRPIPGNGESVITSIDTGIDRFK